MNQDNKPEEKTVQMPVSRMSYSGLTQLLRNPLIFKLKYILNIYDGKMGMGGLVGRAGHEALKFYDGGSPDIPFPTDPAEGRQMAIDIGMKYLTDYNENYINFGKTGTREKMLKNYAQAMKFYFEEEPEYNEVLLVEEKLEAELTTTDGQKLPLPAVGTPDLVERTKEGKIRIIDRKFVKSFTDFETEDYIKIIQAQFFWHLLKAAKGLEADEIYFREIKYTENRNEHAGEPQVRDYAISFDHEAYRIIFYNLYKDVVAFLKNPDTIYLPNLSDPFDGEQAGFLYSQGLISSDMSDVEVMHKVKDVAFVSKKFIASNLDRVENKHLAPEEKIRVRLAEFGIPLEPQETKVGSSVTQYRFKVSRGVRMSSIEKHKADIALAIEAKGEIRILAPIPGTSLVGVEVPNETRQNVALGKKELVHGTLSIPVGVDVNGNPIKVPLNEMPHLLIGGTTGSGKSMLLHAILTALTKQMKPKDMELVLIDPKRVELKTFAKVRHLKGKKIIYEYEQALLALRGLIDEMNRRYKILESAVGNFRNIDEWNIGATEEGKMPYIVVVIDEFGDLMMQGKLADKKEKINKSMKNIATRVAVEAKARAFAKSGLRYMPNLDDEEDEQPTIEEMIIRLASMARAVGIHLIITTQRPSVDVVTGLIKANFPTRIALTTASPADSKVILGEEGAEKLSGKGDMIFIHPGGGKYRLQGFLI